jgi:Na+/melibiose symporter-like transporter
VSLLVDLRPLRTSPTFRRLWVGSTLAAFGEQFASFAIIYFVWDLTKSAAVVGAVSVAIAVPVLVFTMVGGSFADTMDRRRLALITTSGQMIVSSAIVTLLVFDALALWLTFAMVANPIRAVGRRRTSAQSADSAAAAA